MKESPYEDESLEGLLAEFNTPDEVLAAAKQAVRDGFQKLEAHTPFQVEGLAAILGVKQEGFKMRIAALVGGATGLVTAYALQAYTMAVNYPINVAGRRLDSIAYWVPTCFEMTILFSASAAFLALLYYNGLPRLWRPIFACEEYRRATRDKFFLYVEASDPKFHREQTKRYLSELGARGVYEVLV